MTNNVLNQSVDDILLYKTAASNAGQKKYRDGLSTNDNKLLQWNSFSKYWAPDSTLGVQPICDGLLISVAALQQQEGADNCGIFSIAAAYHAAMNDDVGALVFDEPKMRAHLMKCFEKGKLSRFPRTKKATPKRPAPQTIAITLIILQETGLFWGYGHVWQM